MTYSESCCGMKLIYIFVKIKYNEGKGLNFTYKYRNEYNQKRLNN